MYLGKKVFHLIKNFIAWEMLLGKWSSIFYFQVTQVVMDAILEEIGKNIAYFTFSFRAWRDHRHKMKQGIHRIWQDLGKVKKLITVKVVFFLHNLGTLANDYDRDLSLFWRIWKYFENKS